MEEAFPKSQLYIVSVPIGNISDISIRAKSCLEIVDIIACEDTRITGKLLSRLNINKNAIYYSYREENEKHITKELISKINSGKSVALVSDAGTPTISDPGFRLVSACRKCNVPITALPGPCALINALSISGLPTDAFLFIGFLPNKKSARKKIFNLNKSIPYTLIMYESCHRIEKCLEDILEVYGPTRIISVCREMTKLNETIFTGSTEHVIKSVKSRSKKGEFVILIAKESFNL